jgi:alpha-ketoglutarate-dependent taurine dioxygenase
MNSNTLNSVSIKFQLFDKQKGDGLLLGLPDKDNSKKTLEQYLINEKEDVNGLITRHGAILFRGFDIKTAQDFEDIALRIDDNLKNNYLGTSPRNAVTKYVFSASELPPFYPIPQHCEMSFLPHPPRRLFFYCLVAPKKHGETPICDFRKVYEQLDEEVKNAFAEKGVKTIRNYDSPENHSRFNLWQLKRYDELFGTTDKEQIVETCRTHETEAEWMPNGKLRLINKQRAFIQHPVTNETVWFNHTQVFHKDSAAIEYRKIAQRHKNLKAIGLATFTSLMTLMKKLTQKPGTEPMHVTFLDGTEIPKRYVKHLQDTIWNNMVFFQWQKGDVIAIDNYSTSHGRMPYDSPREIYVCWATNN